MSVDIVQEYSFTDLQQALEKRGYVLGKTQLYEYLKQSEVDRVSPGYYSLEAFDRVLCFAQLMLRYRNAKTAKTKFHQHYPQKEVPKNDASTQQTQIPRQQQCSQQWQPIGDNADSGWAGI